MKETYLRDPEAYELPARRRPAAALPDLGGTGTGRARRWRHAAIALLAAVVGYLCGSISFARIIYRLVAPGEELTGMEFEVEGMEEKASEILIAELTSFITQPKYVYSHSWKVGDVLIWDQRAVLHRATPWDYSQPRKLSSLCVSLGPEDGLDAMRQSV